MKTIYDTPEERYGVLDFPCGAERLANGDTLIADAGDEIRRGSEIIQVDRNGQIVWSYTENLIFAHSAQRLPNGNTLITDTTHNRVIEVTYEKEVVFDSNLWGGGTGKLSDGSHLSYPNDAHVMSDGNLIITDRNNDRCVIADKAGKMLWQYSEGIKHPHNADPLPNGNVIIADSDQNRIIEVNRDKRIVWSYGDKEG
ncbi:MAG: PQQ-binding-like beta-propeller repeat protein, partial [Planctomycetes bacterium]|nr:PQQ-binding-like beta-propeller repeat protein [Planctomycetota bacterium]